MKTQSISLQTILLLIYMLCGMSGCISMLKTPTSTPATIADVQSEIQRLQDIVELQQQDMAARLDVGLNDIHESLNTLNRKINTLDESQRAPIVISNEQCPDPLPGQTRDGKLLLGEAEWIWLDATDQAFRARIDTGADTSSISAIDITTFERNSKKWVRFLLSHRDMDKPIQIEAPLERRVRVRQASTENSDRRLVVSLAMRIGNHTEKTEFTLTDRSKMKYPIMLGRDFLKDIAVVDVGHEYMQPKIPPKGAR